MASWLSNVISPTSPLFTAELEPAIAIDTSSSSSAASTPAKVKAEPGTGSSRPRKSRKGSAKGVDDAEGLVLMEQHTETMRDVLISRLSHLSKIIKEESDDELLEVFKTERNAALASLKKLRNANDAQD